MPLTLALASPLGAGVGELPQCSPAAVPVALESPTVLGDGTPGSVSTAALQAALDAGGHVTFDLGPAPATIVLDSELVVSRESVLDGAGTVTLSGGGTRRVLVVTNPQNAVYTLTCSTWASPTAPPRAAAAPASTSPAAVPGRRSVWRRST